MNFENYNKIYQEILDDENNELSSNYLLNKYEIKHDEELINILNQIKKNEYISSDNKVLNRLLSELDEDENLLNINEIIDIKEKVISDNFDEEYFDLEEQINTTKKEENNISEKTKENEINKKNTNFMDNINVNFNIKYTIIIFFAFFIVGSLYFVVFSEDNKEEIVDNNIAISEEVNKPLEKDKGNLEEQNLKIASNEKIKEEAENVENTNTLSTEEDLKVDENIDVKLDNIKVVEKEENNLPESPETIDTNLNMLNTKDMIVLDSLEDIEKYKNQLIYSDGKLIFNDNSYEVNDTLFGFKIYKLTSVYVKFQDEKNQLRKRILLNN